MTRVVLSLCVLLCLAASITAAGFLELRPAGSVAELTGLERDSHRLLVVGAAVPGNQPAHCKARVFDAKGAVLDEADLEVEAGSSAQADFAGLSGAADAQVSCDQPFHAYAAAAAPDERRAIWGQGSGPGAACKFTLNAQPSSVEPGMLGAVLLRDIHMPLPGNAPENRIGVVCINIPHDLSLSRLILEWDVTPADWSPQYPPGSHNLVWLHRGSYVRNTVGNVNVFGRGGNFFAMNQNVDAPKPTTGRLRPANLILGGVATYHLSYTYDAASQKAFFGVSGPGRSESTEFLATASDVSLRIPKKNRWSDSSLFVEFGHFGERKPGRGRPAVPTYGWRYSNLRLRMYQR